MATSPSAIRAGMLAVSAAASAELAAVAGGVAPDEMVPALLGALPLVVPAYYDAAGSLAVAWYGERRAEVQTATAYTPRIVGDPATDWINREAARLLASISPSGDDPAGDLARVAKSVSDMAEREVGRGFRATVTGNVRSDSAAIGWSRFTRPGACKFCVMLAARGAVYKATTARFSAHGAVGRGKRRGGNCQCIAAPEFSDGTHGPEASPFQYLASRKDRTPAQRAELREYLSHNFPDAPG